MFDLDRPAFLGQVSIAQQGTIQPSIFWPGGYGRPVPPSAGGPMTAEITSPGGWQTNEHCYKLPNGSFASLTLPQAKAMGLTDYDRVDNRNCPGLKGVTAPSTAVMAGLGQNGNGGPPAGGGADFSVSPITVGPGPGQPLETRFFNWPQIYPQYPPGNQRFVCKRVDKDENGKDVLECELRPEHVPPPPAYYPTVRFFGPTWF